MGDKLWDGGRRENNDGDGAMKERYWSRTCRCEPQMWLLLRTQSTHLLHKFTAPIPCDRGSELF